MMSVKNRANIETADGKIDRAEMKLNVRGEERTQGEKDGMRRGCVGK